MRSMEAGYIRIGELSRRVGVSPDLLRAWERRYGLLRPERSPGRFRLYSDEDVSRIQRMQGNLARGVSAAEAARLAIETPADAVPEERASPADGGLVRASLVELRRAFDAFDEAGVHAVLDRLLATLGLDTVLRDVVLPALRELGERWARNEITVAQEHFSSNLVRGRLLALGRGWGQGGGQHALLAGPPGEAHDLGLIVFGLALRSRGWRITFLGADSPLSTVEDTARRISPSVVVLAALTPAHFRVAAPELTRLAERHEVAIGGAGASPELAAELGARFLPDGPISAAETIAAGTG
jgi:MerR family transcriptional regulator, light-induced transcriptional regulator